MAYEASEIMMAAALMYSNGELEQYTKDVGTLRQLMIDAKQIKQLCDFGKNI